MTGAPPPACRVELYPAIDIHEGRVVRASRTGLAPSTVYHSDPLAVAENYAAAGARWIHVVDLDRAFGAGDQTPLLSAMARRAGVHVQIGGGLESPEAVEEMRAFGARRVLVGARVAADAVALASLVRRCGAECLGVAIDVRDGRVWGRNWAGAPAIEPGVVARGAREAGVRLVAITDLAREGALLGANVEDAASLARRVGVDVLLSGGVSSLDDLRRAREAGLAGAIVGRALFEGRFTLADALACCSDS